MNTQALSAPSSSNASLIKSEDPNADAGSNLTDMISDLSGALESAINEIHSVNTETKVLALNARIEAARAGNHGAAFGVVAEEMQELSEKTSRIADDMSSRTRDKTSELMTMIGSTVRGTRLSDLALVNIDLIDRNLYERTCDVRWWATDASLVDALTDRTPEAVQHAGSRMGVILKAYTVYYDLVLCDRHGNVIANGKPEEYSSIGEDVSRDPWFEQAMESHSGDDYGFQTAHNSSLTKNQPALIYSCAVRSGGHSTGEPIGALGIVFNWSGLADPILGDIPVSQKERSLTSAYLVDAGRRVIASNQQLTIGETLPLPNFDQVLSRDKGFFAADFNGQPQCIAHAKAPGFETYSTDWYSVISQPWEM